MRSRVVWAGLGLLVGVALTLSGVWLQGLRTDLVDMSGSGSVKVTQTDVSSPYFFEAADLCIEGNRTATITEVRPVMSDGSEGMVKVLEFQLGPSDIEGGVWRKMRNGTTLDAWYEAVDSGNSLPLRVSLACEPSNYERRTLAVLLEVSQVPSAVEGFDIDYTVQGVTKTARTGVGMALCRGDEEPSSLMDSDDTVLERCFEED